MAAQGRNGDSDARQEQLNGPGLEHVWSFSWCHDVVGGGPMQTQITNSYPMTEPFSSIGHGDNHGIYLSHNVFSVQ